MLFLLFCCDSYNIDGRCYLNYSILLKDVQIKWSRQCQEPHIKYNWNIDFDCDVFSTFLLIIFTHTFTCGEIWKYALTWELDRELLNVHEAWLSPPVTKATYFLCMGCVSVFVCLCGERIDWIAFVVLHKQQESNTINRTMLSFREIGRCVCVRIGVCVCLTRTISIQHKLVQYWLESASSMAEREPTLLNRHTRTRPHGEKKIETKGKKETHLPHSCVLQLFSYVSGIHAHKSMD